MALGAENNNNNSFQCQATTQQLSQHQQQQRASYVQHQQPRQRTIAPLPYTKSITSVNSGSGGRSRSPFTFEFNDEISNGGLSPASVVRRNERERNRVKQVNNGFLNLRQHIPAAIVADLSNGRRGIGPGADKKLSKVNTLRMAVEYIRRLQRVLDENESPKPIGATSAIKNNAYDRNAIQQQQHQQKQQQQFYQLNFYKQQKQQQQQQSHAMLSSPTGSSSSISSDSSASISLLPPYSQSRERSYQQLQLQQQQQFNQTHLTAFNRMKEEKIEHAYDDYRNASNSSSAEDDEILDYISLWQDDL